jgi:omega-6 fatty acid desaturase (delta-12 desaturase)
VVNGFIIGRLFILGHDARHQAFTPNRKLNTWLGRMLFMPSLTPTACGPSVTTWCTTAIPT